jgi:tetratricopeptide (TPR) repeat protein
MFGFTRSLGVACSYCHVGEIGKPLTTYNFVSDANPNKEKAREMYRMLGDINEHLKKIKPSGDKPVNMWCHTCHAGRPRPMTLEEDLGERYRAGGIDAAVARYGELKSAFHGRGGYDFGERSLNSFGYSILRQDPGSAVRIFALNTELFPESPNVWDSLGEGYLAAGEPGRARECYQKVLSLEPNNPNAVLMLKKIEEEGMK